MDGVNIAPLVCDALGAEDQDSADGLVAVVANGSELSVYDCVTGRQLVRSDQVVTLNGLGAEDESNVKVHNYPVEEEGPKDASFRCVYLRSTRQVVASQGGCLQVLPASAHGFKALSNCFARKDGPAIPENEEKERETTLSDKNSSNGNSDTAVLNEENKTNRLCVSKLKLPSTRTSKAKKDVIANTNRICTVYLEAADAKALVQCLEAQLQNSSTELSYKARVHKCGLISQIRSGLSRFNVLINENELTPKQIQWNGIIHLISPINSLLLICHTLLGVLEDVYSVALPAVLSIMEQVYEILDPVGGSSDYTSLKTKTTTTTTTLLASSSTSLGMHSERARLQSFINMRKENAALLNVDLNGTDRRLRQLANAGFYFKNSKSSSRVSKLIHFESGVSVPITSHLARRLLKRPVLEHQLLSPYSRLQNGKISTNVTLDVSLSADISRGLLEHHPQKKRKEPSDVDTLTIELFPCNCPRTPLIASLSRKQGIVTVWFADTLKSAGLAFGFRFNALGVPSRTHSFLQNLRETDTLLDTKNDDDSLLRASLNKIGNYDSEEKAAINPHLGNGKCTVDHPFVSQLLSGSLVTPADLDLLHDYGEENIIFVTLIPGPRLSEKSCSDIKSRSNEADSKVHDDSADKISNAKGLKTDKLPYFWEHTGVVVSITGGPYALMTGEVFAASSHNSKISPKSETSSLVEPPQVDILLHGFNSVEPISAAHLDRATLLPGDSVIVLKADATKISGEVVSISDGVAKVKHKAPIVKSGSYTRKYRTDFVFKVNKDRIPPEDLCTTPDIPENVLDAEGKGSKVVPEVNCLIAVCQSCSSHPEFKALLRLYRRNMKEIELIQVLGLNVPHQPSSAVYDSDSHTLIVQGGGTITSFSMDFGENRSALRVIPENSVEVDSQFCCMDIFPATHFDEDIFDSAGRRSSSDLNGNVGSTDREDYTLNDNFSAEGSEEDGNVAVEQEQDLPYDYDSDINGNENDEDDEDEDFQTTETENLDINETIELIDQVKSEWMGTSTHAESLHVKEKYGLFKKLDKKSKSSSRKSSQKEDKKEKYNSIHSTLPNASPMLLCVLLQNGSVEFYEPSSLKRASLIKSFNVMSEEKGISNANTTNRYTSLSVISSQSGVMVYGACRSSDDKTVGVRKLFIPSYEFGFVEDSFVMQSSKAQGLIAGAVENNNLKLPLMTLKCMHYQLTWEHLYFKSYFCSSGRQRWCCVTENGGSLLKWRVQGKLGPDGLEMDADADEDDEDVSIDNSSDSENSSLVDKLNGKEVNEEATNILSLSSSEKEDNANTWELEFTEPAAIASLLVHVELQMRQTTSPRSALMFSGRKCGSAQIPVSRSIKEMYRMTIEAWVRPGWDILPGSDDHHTAVDGSNSIDQDSFSVLHKSNFAGLPQYDLSITRDGKVYFKIWKDKLNGKEEVFTTNLKNGTGAGATGTGCELRSDEWYHLAAVLGRDGLELYVNGDLYAASEPTRLVLMRLDQGSRETKNTSDEDVSVEYGPLHIGGNGKDMGFKGCIRQVRLWAVARTQQQIRDGMHHSVTSVASNVDVDEQEKNEKVVAENSIKNEEEKSTSEQIEISAETRQVGDSYEGKNFPTSNENGLCLVACWPLDGTSHRNRNSKAASEFELNLVCEHGSHEGANDARLSHFDTAEWIQVHVPLMDYTPKLAISATAFHSGQNNNNGERLFSRRRLEGFSGTFDLGTCKAERLLVTLHHPRKGDLATVTALSLRVTGRAQSSIAKWNRALGLSESKDIELDTEVKMPSRYFSSIFDIDSLSLFSKFLRSEKLGRALVFALTKKIENDVGISTAYRLACLQLMIDRANAGRSWDDATTHELTMFVRHHLINSCNLDDGRDLAEKAGRVLMGMVEKETTVLREIKSYGKKTGSEEKKKSTGTTKSIRALIFQVCIELIDEVCSNSGTLEGLEEVVKLLAACWPISTALKSNHATAYTKLISTLCKLGGRLADERKRSPQHNILRTIFGDYSRPLYEKFTENKKGRGNLLVKSVDIDSVSSRNTEDTLGMNEDFKKSNDLSTGKSNKESVLQLQVSVHSKSSGAGLVNTGKKSAKSWSSVKTTNSRTVSKSESELLAVKFTDVLQSKDSIIVLDLGRYCRISSLWAVPFLENANAKVSGSFIVEAWRTPPPAAGEFLLIEDKTSDDGAYAELCAFSGEFSMNHKDSTIGIVSVFPTVVPRGVLIRSGKWYYEVTLVRTQDGVAQIGWADEMFDGDDGNAQGVGDDVHSWAFDGNRSKKWNGGSVSWGKKWRDGNVLGCAADIEGREFRFSLNGSWRTPMGCAFTNAKIHEGIFPAITGERSFRFRVNLGQEPFKYAPPKEDYKSVWTWVKENQDVMQASKFGSHLSEVEKLAAEKPTVVESLNDLDSLVDAVPDSNPNSIKTATHGRKSHVNSGNGKAQVIMRRVIPVGQDEPDCHSSRVSGSWEARYLRLIFSSQDYIDIPGSADYYNKTKRILLPHSLTMDSDDLTQDDYEEVMASVASLKQKAELSSGQAWMTRRSTLALSTLKKNNQSNYTGASSGEKAVQASAAITPKGSINSSSAAITPKGSGSGLKSKPAMKSTVKSTGTSTTTVQTSSGSSKQGKSRPRVTARITISIHGIADYSPQVQALPYETKLSHFMEQKRSAEVKFQNCLNDLREVRTAFVVALERFSSVMGTSGGYLNGIEMDTARDGWKTALASLRSTPLHESASTVSQTLQNVNAALDALEAARERLDWLRMLVREECEIYSDLLERSGRQVKSSPLDWDAVSVYKPEFDATRNVNRWYHAAFLLTRLLVKKFPHEDTFFRGFSNSSSKVNLPILVSNFQLQTIFSHFCVYDSFSAEHRRLAGKLVRQGLRSLSSVYGRDLKDKNSSASFVCEVLENHFSTPSVLLGPTLSFPEHPVFELLKSIVEGGPSTSVNVVVKYLLAQLHGIVGDKNTNPASNTTFRSVSLSPSGSGTFSSPREEIRSPDNNKSKSGFRADLPQLSWTLLLLSHALETENNIRIENDAKGLHQNCVCAVCGTTPIIGARYKSVNLADYDLCETCEGAGRYPDPSFVFLKISRPLPLPPTADQPHRLPTGPLLPNLKTMKPKQKLEGPGDENESTIKEESGAIDSKIHTGIVCDGCGAMPIVGTRFKCVNCDEYNLCSTCEESNGVKEHFPLHVFLKLHRPLPFIEDKNPTALIPNHALIPVLLHPSLYPHLKSKRAAVEKQQVGNSDDEDDDNTANSTSRRGSIGSSSDDIKLIRTKSHILNTSGRWGKPSANPFAAVIAMSEVSVLDSPPARRNVPRFSFDEGDIQSSIKRVCSTGISSASSTSDALSPPSTVINETKMLDTLSNSHALQVLFSIMSSSVLLCPLQLEVFLITAKVLQQLVEKSEASTVISELLNHESFDDFIHQIAACTEPFVHSAVIKLCESICRIPPGVGARRLLRSKVISALEPPPGEPAFVLELLLVTLSVTTVNEDSTIEDNGIDGAEHGSLIPLRKALSAPPTIDRRSISRSNGELLLEDVREEDELVGNGDRLNPKMVSKLLCLFETVPLRSASCARAWAFAFRMLRCFSDPANMLRGEGRWRLQNAIRSALMAGSVIVSLVESDLVKLLVVLLDASIGETRVGLQTGILDMLVQAFLVASPVNPRLYRRLVSALHDSLACDQDPASGLNAQALVSLVESVATAISTEAHATCGTLGKDDLELLQEVLALISEPLCKSEEFSDAASSLRQMLLQAVTTPRNGIPGPAHSFLEWLSDVPPSSDITRLPRSRLKETILVFLGDILGREGLAAAPLLDLCIDMLNDPHMRHSQPEPIAQVVRTLISREPLAQHLAASLSRILQTSVSMPHVGERAHSFLLASVSSAICNSLGNVVETVGVHKNDLALTNLGELSTDASSSDTSKTQTGMVKSKASTSSSYEDITHLCKVIPISSSAKISQKTDSSVQKSKLHGKEKLKVIEAEELTSLLNQQNGSSSAGGDSKKAITVEHIYSENSGSTKWEFILQLPSDALLEAIELDFLVDSPLKGINGRSAAPSRIAIETGNALQRLSPSGIATSFVSNVRADSRNASTSTAKVRMNAPIAAKIIRVVVLRPVDASNAYGEDEGEKIRQEKREELRKLRMTPNVGDKVVRGADWRWGSQGGDDPNSVGVISAITNWNGIKGKAVRVRWANGTINAYRWGFIEGGVPRYDVKLAPDLDSSKPKAVILSRITIRAGTLRPQHLAQSSSYGNQRSLGLILELLSTACIGFPSVQRCLATTNPIPLASALVQYLPNQHTSRNARAVVVLLAKHNVPLASALVKQMLGPIHIAAPAHAALAAELCTMHDDGTETRLLDLWNFVLDALDSGESNPLLVPYLYALAIAIEEAHLNGSSNSENYIYKKPESTPFQYISSPQDHRIISLLMDMVLSAAPGSTAEKSVLTLLCTLIRSEKVLRDLLYAIFCDGVNVAISATSSNHYDEKSIAFLRVFGIVCSCHPELIEQCKPLLKKLWDYMLTILNEDSTCKGYDSQLQTFCAILGVLSNASHSWTTKQWIGEIVLEQLLYSLIRKEDEISGTKLKTSSAKTSLLLKKPWRKARQAALGFVRTVVNLHKGNQNKVAQLLVEKMGEGKLNQFLLSLLTETVLFQPTVTVSVWQPYRVIDHLVNGLYLPSKKGRNDDNDSYKILLDPAQCGETIEISANGTCATQATYEKWGMVRADKPLPTSGVSTWDVSIDTSPKGHIFVGVATSRSNLNSYLGNDKHGWGYIGNRGAWHNRHKVKTYGHDFRSGHVVTVRLDMDEGVLSFSLNGEDLGVAFNENLKGKRLFPAFALYQKGDSCTIKNCSIAKSATVSAGQEQSYSSTATVSAGNRSNNTAMAGTGAFEDIGAAAASVLLGDLNSPLRFHRPGPVHTMPAYATCYQAIEAAGAFPEAELAETNNHLYSPVVSPVSASGSAEGSPVHHENPFYSSKHHRKHSKRCEWELVLPSVEKVKEEQHVSLRHVALSKLLTNESEVLDIVKEGNSRFDRVRSLMGEVGIRGLKNMDKSIEYPESNLKSQQESMLQSAILNSETKKGKPFGLLSSNIDNREMEPHPSPIILNVAEIGGLPKMITLARSKTSITPNMQDFLFDLERFLLLPGFASAFVSDRDCIGLLLYALGVSANSMSVLSSDGWSDAKRSIQPSAEAVKDPRGALLKPLMKLFCIPSQNPEARNAAFKNGIVDCLFLRIGKLQAEKPRKTDRTDKFLAPSERVKSDQKSIESKGQVVSETSSSSADKNDIKKTSESKESNKKQMWAPGFGHGNNDTTQADRERHVKMKEKAKHTIVTVQCLASLLTMTDDVRGKISSDAMRELKCAVESSCLLGVCMSFLFGNTIKVLLDGVVLYKSIFRLLHALTRLEMIVPIFGKVPGVYRSVQELVSGVHELLQDCSDDEQEASSDDNDNDNDISVKGDIESNKSKVKLKLKMKGNIADESNSEKKSNSDIGDDIVYLSSRTGYVDIPDDISLHALVKATLVAINASVERIGAVETEAQEDGSTDSPTSDKDSDPQAVFEEHVNKLYEAEMQSEQFKNQTLFEVDGNFHHHYRNQIEEDINGKVSKTRARRLNRELKALKKSLPLHFSSSVFLRVDPNRPFILQALITGPVRTPYESGCFLFDIYIPSGYPSEPPKVNLMTTGNGTVRFNPNLYNNGKVCLSLLGTWRGGASGSEQWQKTSTIYQVLVSIQSLILGSEYPYFNEPGVEAQWGTEQGEIQKRIHSNGGYERLRVATTQHAMLGMLLHPPAGFENMIENHFLIKKHVILNRLQEWLHEASASDSKGHFRALSKCAQELRKELAKLGSSKVDELIKERDEIKVDSNNITANDASTN